MRLLLVEDDPELGRRLSERLRNAGFAVDLAANRADAENWPDVDKMAAVILDLGLPDGDGMKVLGSWRNRKVDTPVIILTARGAWEDKVAGLNKGADDFVVKPVRFEELLARLNALFRRQNGTRNTVAEVGSLALDPLTSRVDLDGNTLALSKQEFRLLHLFMRRAGQVLSQSDILENLYDLESERELNTVEVLVGRLRRKIGKKRITTLRGLGYRLEAQ
ncbi:response regulator [Qipengyuania sp.]|uniref:response regulator n=1 Tax=Qipengyuania sp. TaxID=2004515 RepID=UPI003BAA96F7